MISIDSCKIRFDMKHVKVINPDLLTRWGEISEHSEIGEREFKRKRFTVKENGVTTSYLIEKRKVYGGQMVESLLILVNSKLLKDRYFDGICSDTLELLYRAIMDQKVVFINWKDFQYGALTDCDIKRDFQVKDKESQVNTVKTLKALTRPTREKDRGAESRTLENNIGIQFTKREHASFSNSHVKVYAKDVELFYHSNIFYDNYFGGVALPPTMRVECTIKNKGHFRYLIKSDDEHQQFTLSDLLALDQMELSGIMSRMMLQHLERPTTDTKTHTGLRMSELFCLSLLEELMRFEKNLNVAIGLAKVRVSNLAKNRSQAHQARKKIDHVCLAYLDGMGEEIDTSTNPIFDFIYGTSDVL